LLEVFRHVLQGVLEAIKHVDGAVHTDHVDSVCLHRTFNILLSCLCLFHGFRSATNQKSSRHTQGLADHRQIEKPVDFDNPAVASIYFRLVLGKEKKKLFSVDALALETVELVDGSEIGNTARK